MEQTKVSQKQSKQLEKSVAEELVNTQYPGSREGTKKTPNHITLPRFHPKTILYLVVSVGLVVLSVGIADMGSALVTQVKERRQKEVEWLPKTDGGEEISDGVNIVASPSASVTAHTDTEVVVITLEKSSNPLQTPQMDIKSFIRESFALEDKIVGEYILKVFYDYKSQGQQLDTKQKFDTSYYVLTNKGLFEAGKKIYQGIDITVTKAPDQLVSYLEDIKYCQVDLDCSIRGHFCTYGAFNNYQPVDETLTCVGAPVSEQDEEFGVFSDQLQCVTQLEFSKASCSNNRCVGLDKKINCQKK